MKNSLYTRRIDDLGRIVIPRDIRKSLGIKKNDEFNIYLKNKSIVFEKSSIELDYEDILRKHLLIKYGNEFQDYYIEKSIVLDLENYINEVIKKLIKK